MLSKCSDKSCILSIRRFRQNAKRQDFLRAFLHANRKFLRRKSGMMFAWKTTFYAHKEELSRPLILGCPKRPPSILPSNVLPYFCLRRWKISDFVCRSRSFAVLCLQGKTSWQSRRVLSLPTVFFLLNGSRLHTPWHPLRCCFWRILFSSNSKETYPCFALRLPLYCR